MIKPFPKIAITMGDPAGIGPELCAKLLDLEGILSPAVPVILGDSALIQHYADVDGIHLDAEIIRFSPTVSLGANTKPTIVDFGLTDRFEDFGQVSATAGNAAYKYIATAINWHLESQVDAIVTGPINKLSLNAAGYRFPGHTEILAEMTATDDFCMMQYSDELTCSFATTHIGYADVLNQLTTERILSVIRLTHKALKSILGRLPTLVACGLNPHAGEDGLFGNREEELIIAPAIQTAIAEGIRIEGPYPPDTCFIPTRRKTTDGFICMHHDQGHIPLKALVFDKAVNVTLGLPIIRTSVDHGTAFDIVGQNTADPSSLIAACELAVKLANQKRNCLAVKSQ